MEVKVATQAEGEAKKREKKSAILPLFALAFEGLSFGSMYAWALSGKTTCLETSVVSQRSFSLASFLGLLLMLDKDVYVNKVGELDQALIALHFVFSLQHWFEGKLARGYGPYGGTGASFPLAFPVLSFIVHFRAFMHLMVHETQRSLFKKLALVASFYWGAKLSLA